MPSVNCETASEVTLIDGKVSSTSSQNDGSSKLMKLWRLAVVLFATVVFDDIFVLTVVSVGVVVVLLHAVVLIVEFEKLEVDNFTLLTRSLSEFGIVDIHVCTWDRFEEISEKGEEERWEEHKEVVVGVGEVDDREQLILDWDDNDCNWCSWE